VIQVGKICTCLHAVGEVITAFYCMRHTPPCLELGVSCLRSYRVLQVVKTFASKNHLVV